MLLRLLAVVCIENFTDQPSNLTFMHYVIKLEGIGIVYKTDANGKKYIFFKSILQTVYLN